MADALLIIVSFHLVLWISLAVLAALEPPRRAPAATTPVTLAPTVASTTASLDSHRREPVADAPQSPRAA